MVVSAPSVADVPVDQMPGVPPLPTWMSRVTEDGIPASAQNRISPPPPPSPPSAPPPPPPATATMLTAVTPAGGAHEHAEVDVKLETTEEPDVITEGLQAGRALVLRPVMSAGPTNRANVIAASSRRDAPDSTHSA